MLFLVAIAVFVVVVDDDDYADVVLDVDVVVVCRLCIKRLL